MFKIIFWTIWSYAFLVFDAVNAILRFERGDWAWGIYFTTLSIIMFICLMFWVYMWQLYDYDKRGSKR